MKTNNIIKIAKKEIIFNLNNYWFFLSVCLFCTINFLIIYFAEIISGDHTQTDIRALSLSIIHLQMYLIPLLSFILSYDSILAERENGTLDLIISYRINLLDLLIGKLLGNSTVLSASFLIGFFPIAVYLYALGIDKNILLNFELICIWLILIFNFFAIYISNLSKDRTFVIFLSILIWLFFVFIYDIFFTLVTVYFYGILSKNFLNMILFLNPVEVFRLISIFIFIPSEANDLFGINIGILKLKYILIVMITWIIGLAFIFFSLYKKR